MTEVQAQPNAAPSPEQKVPATDGKQQPTTSNTKPDADAEKASQPSADAAKKL